MKVESITMLIGAQSKLINNKYLQKRKSVTIVKYVTFLKIES